MDWSIRAAVEGIDEFVGIDHHKRHSTLVIKDREGRTLKRGRIPTTREAFRTFLGESSGCRWAVFEAGARYRPLERWLREMVDGSVMANPRQLKVISQTAYKSDTIDARKLAELLMLGIVPESHVCSDEAWDRRQLLRQRLYLVRMRTGLKNRIHSVVDQHPDAVPARPEVTDLFGKLGMSWLESVELPGPDRKRLDELLEFNRFLAKRISLSDAAVRQLVRSDVRAQWLTTAPGIGNFSAALITAEVDDVRRFPNSKRFVSYTGLVSRRDQSAAVDKELGIHKSGNHYLRWILVEAAVPAISTDLALRSLYDRVRARNPRRSGRRVAKVAVARKLAEIVYRLLVEERPYEKR